jgi:oxygen-independent coproporphyrinogen-3 oxidase
MTRLDQMLRGSPYQGYSYAYPHKTAYRRLPEPVPLRSLWAGERRESLFLYLHVPFCEMRCGFCNLFTQAQPQEDIVRCYLEVLAGEARQVRSALGEARFARLAVGGGTPTFLNADELAMLFDLATEVGAEPGRIPTSVETSPATVDADRLALLRERGVSRISLGVQSFWEAEVHAAGRPQRTADVEVALDRIRAAGFSTLNIDLIYGLPGQTVACWLHSLRSALRWRPEELYLYPLYVRPLTGLGRAGRDWDDLRLECYRAGRDLLLDSGYEQISMRLFVARHAPAVAGPVYCCQEDGMVGLGCGARSYTRALHYSREYAVGAQGVRAILADYLSRPEDAAAFADYGFRLGPDDQRRRFVLQSLLQRNGLDWASYRSRFGTDALDDLPELAELAPRGLAQSTAAGLRLTDAGLERSDTIGPWLYSARVRGLMEDYSCR